MSGKAIALAEIGYFGLSNAVLLTQRNRVRALNVDSARPNAGESPVSASDISRYLAEITLDVTARAPEATIVVKSTVPVGFTCDVLQRLSTDQVIFSPEFPRECKALRDNLNPSRIVMGERSGRARIFAGPLPEAALDPYVPTIVIDPTAAEAIKLSANTYLALHIAYFNEPDSYVFAHGLDPRQIIDGVGLGPRIGTHYHNSSLGYGGYCLPKNSKQSIVKLCRRTAESYSGRGRGESHQQGFHLGDDPSPQPALCRHPPPGDEGRHGQFRQSSVQGNKAKGIEVIVHEPAFADDHFFDSLLMSDLTAFKAGADVIVANRKKPEHADVATKVFTEDIFAKPETPAARHFFF